MDTTKSMIILGCMLFMILFTQSIFSENIIYINNIDELTEKNYEEDIELVIEYTINTINEVYKYATASIEIISLYADDVLIKGIENEVIVERYMFLTEFIEGTSVQKTKILDYRPNENEWFFFLMPRGSNRHLKSYHIPHMTQKLTIVYRIMFPGGDSSEENEAVLIIRS